MTQPSLFTSLPETGPARPSAAPPVALPCPGNCAALRYAQGHALSAAQRTRAAGLRAETGCRQCGGVALARVTHLAPLTLESSGGIPRRPPWMGWDHYAAWRAALLQQRVLGGDWRRRRVYLPGWCRVVIRSCRD